MSHPLRWTKQKQQEVIKEIEKKLDITHWEQWYKVTYLKLNKLGGDHTLILGTFNNSISKMLKAVYPDLPWKDYQFERKPRSFWKEEKNQREFLIHVASTLKIKKWPGIQWS